MDEYDAGIEAYDKKWRSLLSGRQNTTFFAALQPTALGWKTKDRAEFDNRFAILRDQSDQIHLGWVNERWLAVLHLTTPLAGGISLLKLMERRPGSVDATGLDHVDYLIPTTEDIKPLLSAEPDLRWSEETNGIHCKWISLWFDRTEAKLRRDTTMQPCIDDMLEVQQAVMRNA